MMIRETRAVSGFQSERTSAGIAAEVRESKLSAVVARRHARDAFKHSLDEVIARFSPDWRDREWNIPCLACVRAGKGFP